MDPFEVMQHEKARLLQALESLKAADPEALKEELLNYLECHDPAKYRKKIKGFRLAFNIREK